MVTWYVMWKIFKKCFFFKTDNQYTPGRTQPAFHPTPKYHQNEFGNKGSEMSWTWEVQQRSRMKKRSRMSTTNLTKTNAVFYFNQPLRNIKMSSSFKPPQETSCLGWVQYELIKTPALTTAEPASKPFCQRVPVLNLKHEGHVSCYVLSTLIHSTPPCRQAFNSGATSQNLITES